MKPLKISILILFFQRNPTELYVANSQQPNESLIDVQQQKQQQQQANLQTYQQQQQHQIPLSSHSILQSRIQQHHQQSNSIPNVFHHQASPQPNVPFEEYETPPRLRRNIISHQQPTGINALNSSAASITHHRQNRHPTHHNVLNGRGIMGQGPKPHLRTDNMRPPVNNFS